MSMSSLMRRALAYALTALLAFTGLATPAHATDDRENSTPTAWWIYTGQSLQDIKDTINAKQARLVDIDEDSPSTFTATYVRNAGSYGKSWWFYVGVDAATVAANLTANKARLVSLKAYDAGGGNLRFAVVMVANTGADAKSWWWYYGKTPDEIAALTKANNARLVTLQSYGSGSSTRYAVVMIANTGADTKGWWWYYNLTPAAIKANVATNKARLIGLTPAAGGNFNAVMESCQGGCPGWWWYFGINGQGVVDYAMDNGARANTTSSYDCGTSKCFVTTMISNAPDDVVSCDASGCISQAKLRDNICSTLSSKVVGYTCEVGAVRPGYGGKARTSVDGAMDMAPHLDTNIASVSKTITAIAVMKMLAAKNHTVDDKISPFIYSDWTQGSNIGSLTFRHLLTHTSGFTEAGDCGRKTDYAGLKAMVAGGVTAANIGKATGNYGNCNFALVRELMLVLSGASPQADATARASQSANAYIAYVNANVLKPVGVNASACKAATGNSHLLSYSNASGSQAGTDWGDWTLNCGGGGWVLSTNDMFRVMNDVATGSTLLNSTQRKAMIQGNLGWDSAVRGDCPNPNVCKNGSLFSGTSNNQRVWTYAGVLKCDVPVVVVVNSPLPSPYETTGGDIIGVVANALSNSVVAGTKRNCF